jgi:hypothetical protein
MKRYRITKVTSLDGTTYRGEERVGFKWYSLVRYFDEDRGCVRVSPRAEVPDRKWFMSKAVASRREEEVVEAIERRIWGKAFYHYRAMRWKRRTITHKLV